MSELQQNPAADTDVLFQKRWSPRAFDAGRKVSRDKILSCLEAARWAPSCFNDQPWRFVVCCREESEQAWLNMLGCLTPRNQQWAQAAPVLIMVCTNTLFAHNGKENRWAEYDAGAAAVSLCLQAAALGLETHQMGGFDATAVAEQFEIPELFTPIAAIALGYRGEATQLEDDFRVTELAPRNRKPLAEVIFFENWQDSANEVKA